jgi:DNA-binding MarR family transcriptional regulator
VDLDFSAHRLATGLARVAVAVQLAGDAAEPGLERTIAQQQVLLLLSHRREVYPLTELSANLGMTPAATLGALTTLQREGLVSMGPSPSYAPQDVRVALTERGRAHSPEVLNWAAQLLAELHHLDRGAQRQLLAVVTDQIRRLQRQGRIPVTKMCLSCRFFDGYAHSSLTEPHHCWLVDGAFGHLQLRLRCPEAQQCDGSEPVRSDVDPPRDARPTVRPAVEVDPPGER